MKRVARFPLSMAALAVAMMLASGCGSENKPGDGGEPTEPAPAGTNIPAPGTGGGTGGAPTGANIPGSGG